MSDIQEAEATGKDGAKERGKVLKRLHVMSNSHLDREHRHAFQETRIMMVQMMDELIALMENDPDYQYFTLDGQAIVLDDYLEVKPEMRGRLTKLIQAGRILIGPWYSLVDCYAVNPESIIRNLLTGDRVCKRFGQPMKLGYSIFSFGQMAQLPQVYAGFSIHDIVFYKGASPKVFPQSEFLWRAPDGTEAFATRLGKEKRWNFFFDFDIPVILGGDAKKPGWQSKFTDSVKLCHLNDAAHCRQYATELQPDFRIRSEKIEQSVETVMSLLGESASEHVFLAFDGTDFTSPLPQIPQAIKEANEIMGDRLQLVHSNPTAYFEEVKKDIDLGSLVKYEGEMRFGPINQVHAETMGTNSEIKQAMFHAENALIYYAEPLSSFLKANGGVYEKEILDLAWKYLLSAQAHDSIHGSGDPKIKTDNLNRIAQAQEIADSITRRAVEGLTSLVRTDDNGGITVAVFNTTPYQRSEIMRMVVDLPAEELAEDVWLEEMDGERVETWRLSRYPFNLAMVHRKNRPKSVYSDRYEFQVHVKDLPPMGYKRLRVKWVRGNENTSTNPFPLGVFPYQPIGRSGNVLDNGLLRATVNGDGTVDVYDYETGRTTAGLNSLTDTGSSGDFWVHRAPYHNRTIVSKGCAGQIEFICNTGLSATCRVTFTMDIPEGLNSDRTARDSHLIPTEFVTEITLNKGARRIDFKTSLDNHSGDHMLVADFPTHLVAESASWESPFEIRQREVDRLTDVNGAKGPELERQAMQNFIDVSDGKSGVALFTKGLKEAGTTDEGGAIVHLTLFRATSNTFPIHNDLLIGFQEETAQCYGRQTFEYAVFFHQGDCGGANVAKEARKYIVPPISAEIGSGSGGKLPGSLSFLKLSEGKLLLSAVKLAEEDSALVLRLNNPYGERVCETLEFFNPILQADEVDMNEEHPARLACGEHTLRVQAQPYKIITLKVKLRG